MINIFILSNPDWSKQPGCFLFSAFSKATTDQIVLANYRVTAKDDHAMISICNYRKQMCRELKMCTVGYYPDYS